MSKLSRREFTGLADLFIKMYENWYPGKGSAAVMAGNKDMIRELEAYLITYCQWFGENFSVDKWRSYIDKAAGRVEND